jgi:hypothetical protein
MMAKIEFYIGQEPGHIAVVDDGAVPREGEFINIRQVTYRVVRVTWAVDGDVDRFRGATLRANVELEHAPT